MSILCFIAHGFRPHRKAVLFTRLLLRIIGLYYSPVLFIEILRCIPVHKTWEPIVAGSCVGSEYQILYADCAINFITDVGILVLPIPLVWQLQIFPEAQNTDLVGV